MKKLWVQLTLAFAVVVIIGLTLVAFLANKQVSDGFKVFFVNNQMMNSDLPLLLVDYYGSTGSWDGVEVVFDGETTHGMGMGHGIGMMRGGMSSVILADTDGRIVYDETGNAGGELSREDKFSAMALDWENRTVGYLLMQTPLMERIELTASAEAFLGLINRALFQAGIVAALVGLLLGVVIARGLAAPLGQLASAARRISHGELTQRVPVKGTEEVADVALAFNEMATELERAETLRRNMVADVAHELRTPLSVLQGNLRAILDDVYPLEKSEIARLYDQTRLLGRLVSDLRELAQADAGQLELNLTRLELPALLRDVVAGFAPAAEAEGITLTTRIDDSLPPVNADSARLAQVLHNLLANALRHTPEGGAIELSAEYNTDGVQIVVRDTGEGIAAEDLSRVFDRFYRVDRARSRAAGGSGLGLSIVRTIVEAHGGGIRVASEGVGQGSAFTVHLPFASKTA